MARHYPVLAARALRGSDLVWPAAAAASLPKPKSPSLEAIKARLRRAFNAGAGAASARRHLISQIPKQQNLASTLILTIRGV
jgi:hypothetical protein